MPPSSLADEAERAAFLAKKATNKMAMLAGEPESNVAARDCMLHQTLLDTAEALNLATQVLHEFCLKVEATQD